MEYKRVFRAKLYTGVLSAVSVGLLEEAQRIVRQGWCLRFYVEFVMVSHKIKSLIVCMMFDDDEEGDIICLLMREQKLEEPDE